MSDGHGHEHDDAADAHDDHGFDGEPAKELSPGEPMTPGWLPLVGAALFGLAAVYLVASRDAEPGAATGAATAPAAQQPAKQIVATAMPQPRPSAPPRPAASGTSLPAIRKLTPDEVKEAGRRLQEAQKKKAAEGAK